MTLYAIHRSLEEVKAGEFGIVTHGIWKPLPDKVEVAVKSLNVSATNKDRI